VSPAVGLGLTGIGAGVDVSNANARGTQSMGVDPDVSFLQHMMASIFGIGKTASEQLSDEMGAMGTTPDGNMSSAEDDLTPMNLSQFDDDVNDGMGNASGEGPGGSAGMGDSPDSPSGTW
jgi:hypothetical protein